LQKKRSVKRRRVVSDLSRVTFWEVIGMCTSKKKVTKKKEEKKEW